MFRSMPQQQHQATIVPEVMAALDALVKFAKDKGPGMIESVKAVIGNIQELFQQGAAAVGSLGKMDAEETVKALDKLQAELDVALSNVQGAVPPKLSTDE